MNIDTLYKSNTCERCQLLTIHVDSWGKKPKFITLQKNVEPFHIQYTSIQS